MEFKSSREIYRFGTFELEITARRLQKEGRKIPLEEKPFRLLAVMVSQAGETLTREELCRVLWPDNVNVGFGHGLNNAVNKVRSALGDSAENPRFIATVQRVGYRFIAPVERERPDSYVQGLTVTTESLHQPEIAASRATAHFLSGVGRLVFVAILVSLFAAAFFLISVRRSRSRVSLPEPLSALARKAGEAYAMGIDSRRFVGEEALGRSKEYLQQAIALDPTFAEAYAQLALTDVLIGDEASLAPKSDYERALAEAGRALELDPALAEAHVAFGNAKLRMDLDWDLAKREYLRALDLDPNSVNALEAYARFLGATGQNSESLRVIERAQMIDPLSVRIRYDKAVLSYLARDYQQAIAEFVAVAEVQPEFADARKSLSDAYARAGQWNEAASELVQWLKQIQVGQEEIAATQRILRKEGLRELWRRHAHGDGCARNEDSYGIPFNKAAYSALLGETQPTIKWLHGAYEQHDPRLLNLKVDPQFDEVRSDPQFAKFLEKIGLMQYE